MKNTRFVDDLNVGVTLKHGKTWIDMIFAQNMPARARGGFSKRELYSDDADVIYNFKRCVGLNGINIVARARTN